MLQILKIMFLECVVLLNLAMTTVAHAEVHPTKHTSEANLKAIRKILELPDEQIDLGKVKLTIDRMIDPRIDIASNIKKLDAMASEVKVRIPANAFSRDVTDRVKIPPCRR